MLKSSNLSTLAHLQQPGRLRAATLVRVSTAEQANEGRSGLERQRRANASSVESIGCEVVANFEIVDVSGSQSFQSSEMLELVAMIETNQVDLVICSEISRLFRPSDLSSFASLDVFKRNQVQLCCGGTMHDLASPEGFLSSGIMSLLGGYERLSMLRKMLQSKEASRANGFCPSADITLPLGLKYDRKANKFGYTAEIWKLQEAARLIDEEGLRNISEVGRRVSIPHFTLRNLLKNPYLVGIREYNQLRDQTRKSTKPGGRQGDRPKIKRAPEQVIRVRIIAPEEQAVSDERFERIQMVFKEMAERHARFVSPHKGINLLTSTGFCGYCGSRLYTTTTSRRNDDGSKGKGYYVCKSHYYLFKGKMPACSQGWLQRTFMDELVEAFILHFLKDRDFLSAILNHAKFKQRDTIVDIGSASDSVSKQISDLEKRDRRLLDAIESGAVSLAEVKQRRQRLHEEKQALLATLSSIDGQEVAPSMPRGLVGRLAAMGTEAWTSLTCPRERKKLISGMFMEIYVKGESITAFRLAPSLVGSDSGEWAWVADIPVTLPEPFRIRPVVEKVDVPDGRRQCCRCFDVLPVSEFYTNGAACKPCLRADAKKRYRAKVEAAKAARLQA